MVVHHWPSLMAHNSAAAPADCRHTCFSQWSPPPSVSKWSCSAQWQDLSAQFQYRCCRSRWYWWSSWWSYSSPGQCSYWRWRWALREADTEEQVLKRRSSHYQCRSCLAHSRSAVANFLYLQKRIFYCNNKQDLVSEKQLNSSPVFSKHLFTFRSLPLLLLLGLRSLSWTLNSFRFRFLCFHWWL